MERGNVSTPAMPLATVPAATTNGSFQNHPPPEEPPDATPRGRKRGISALLEDVTNTGHLDRMSALKAKRALKSQNSVQAARGNPARGGKLRQGQTVSVAEHESVHLLKLVHDRSLLGTVYSSLAGFIQRNVSFEVQKAIAINMMITALLEWNCTILQAAQHAANCCGFKPATVRLWATTPLLSEASTCSAEEFNDDEYITQCQIADTTTIIVLTAFSVAKTLV